MSLERIKFNRLVKIIYSDQGLRKSRLREDIRNELKPKTEENTGNDFYVPFWADVKSFIRDGFNLQEQTNLRIAANKYRKNLYPKLMGGFNEWWNNQRSWRTMTYTYMEDSVRGSIEISETASLIKLENLIPLKLADSSCRIIYPYFADLPALTGEGARMMLWGINNCFPNFSVPEIGILDILRGRSFNSENCALHGNEREILVERCKLLIKERDALKKEYWITFVMLQADREAKSMRGSIQT